jgi:hypothetical protein
MSDDPFSGPDPAPVPGDDDLATDVRVVAGDVACANCAHRPVCSYYEGIQSMLEQKEEVAFEADDLAVICDEFTVPDDDSG